MANDKLRYEISADSKGFVGGVNKAKNSAGSLGTGKGKKRSGAALNQLAYALDDLQYGFRGVQNNLQQIAVQSGATGSTVLALTALTIAIGYVIEHWEDFQTETSAALKDAQDFAEAIAKGSAAYNALEFYADILDDSTSSVEAKTYALKQLKESGYDPATMSIKNFLKEKKKELALSAAEGVYKEKLTKSAEAQAEAEELKLEIAEKQAKFDSLSGPLSRTTSRGGVLRSEITEKGILGNEILALESEVRKFEEKAQVIKKRANDIYLGILNALLNPEEGDAIIDGGDLPAEIAKTLKATADEFGLGLDEITAAFQKWVSTGESGVEGLNKVFDEMDAAVKEKLGKVLETTNAAANAFNSAVGNAFGNIGEAIGEALAGDDEIGAKFLKSLAVFLKSFGSALIAVGIAEDAFLKSWSPEAKIAAGIGLIIAGAALSKAYSKKPGSSGGSSGSGGYIRSASSASRQPVTPDAYQGSGRASGRIGQITSRGGNIVIPADTLRYALQVGNERYTGKS